MKKILIISNTPIANKMTGPSIRMLNIAKTLQSKFEVILYSFQIENELKKRYSFISKKSFIHEILKCDYVYSQPSRFRYLFISKLLRKKIIIDLYDPTDIENLEMYKNKTSFKTKLIQYYSSYRLKYAIKIADYFVCSNETQKDYWIGYFQGLNRIKNKDYKIDNSLSNIIGLLPYGIEGSINYQEKNIVHKKFNLNKNDKVIVWAGGIWNWFDTENLIKSMRIINDKDKSIKLLFLGVPSDFDSTSPKYKKLVDTIDLAKKYNLFDKNIFFNNEWIDYNKRQKYLLDCYAGISLHYNNIETRFSFRTRILDYLWTDLPFITSDGDYFGNLCKTENLGITINNNNPDNIAKSIIEMCSNNDKYLDYKRKIEILKNEFLWEKTCKELITYINNSNNLNNNNLISSTFYLLLIPFRIVFDCLTK